MTDIPFYIRLSSQQALDKSDALAWYRCVKNNVPEGLLNVVHTTNPQGDPDVIFMIHKESKTGQHFYDIHLVRDLSVKEADVIEQAYQDGKGEIETSSEEVKAARQGPADAVVMNEDLYNNLCEALAKHQHQRWLDQRSDAGWSFGLKINSETKQHPMLRPWEQLPEQYRDVDYELPHLFMNLLAKQGFVVVGRDDLNKWLKKN